MKWFIVVAFIMMALSGYSHYIDDSYYDRANKGNDKAQKEEFLREKSSEQLTALVRKNTPLTL